MKNRSGEKIKLASIDELLGVVNEESAMAVSYTHLDVYKRQFLENNLQADGSVRIPKALQPYMGGKTELSK